MESQQALNRTCPTRIDGVRALLAHQVTKSTCAEKQRQRYHKCFTCRFNHAYVAQHGLPEPAVAGAKKKSRPAS
ncbi:MAG: hypothetical protein AAF368_19085 [Planctomycetota bacterium]